MTDDPFAQPEYREAIVDLLGGLAYGELTAFSRLAGDAELAPTLDGKAALARIAVIEFGHYQRIEARLQELGVDPRAAMEPFVAPFDAFHDRTAPKTWLEGLVKAYVGDGIASDFYTEISAFVDPGTRELMLSVLDDMGHDDFVVETVVAATQADPSVSGRLALWGRRLVGEAFEQRQHLLEVVVRRGPAARTMKDVETESAPSGRGDALGHIFDVLVESEGFRNDDHIYG